MSAPAVARRHAGFVRVTHWLTTLAFLALLVSGGEVLLSHPRFYWGETGNVEETPLFVIPVPSSRPTVPTGYDYVLPDQNGWSRYLHFQSAWLLALTGVVYLGAGLGSGHFRTNLVHLVSRLAVASRSTRDRGTRAVPFRGGRRSLVVQPAATDRLSARDLRARPVVIWTGLAMSPGFTAIWPTTVTLLGGKQSARTLHFAGLGCAHLFLFVHLVMLVFAGFTTRVRAMITGEAEVRP